MPLPRPTGKKMSSLPIHPSHEDFVQPSSYLRPREPSRPMPHAEQESAVDRDQRIGLVRESGFVFYGQLACSACFCVTRLPRSGLSENIFTQADCAVRSNASESS